MRYASVSFLGALCALAVSVPVLAEPARPDMGRVKAPVIGGRPIQHPSQ
jgi:hypothetical protein